MNHSTNILTTMSRQPLASLGMAIFLALPAFAQMDSQQRPKPPKEAISACANASENQACSFNHRQQTLSGQCLNPPQSSDLICVPEGHRPPPQGGQQQSQGQSSNLSDNAQKQKRTQQQSSSVTNNRSFAPPRARQHTVTQITSPLLTLPSNTPAISPSLYAETAQTIERQLAANGVSIHNTGQFPNANNPNTISEQSYSYSVPLHAEISAQGSLPVWGYSFGMGVNGVPFDPSAAEWYLGERHSEWQYAALSGAIELGLDDNHAHVQPNGAYHYHGKPTGLLVNQGVDGMEHSDLIGWAADGFPIYALYGYQNSSATDLSVKEQFSSYQIKPGLRPSGEQQPGGYYDGTFIADYEYIEGLGTLDECNGRTTVTPEFPEGTYAYFISNAWPQIPRCFKGSPDQSFRKDFNR